MRHYFDDEEIPTLESALCDRMNTDDLRKLAAFTGEKVPARKLDIAAVIIRHLEGERLRTVWQGLDELQRAAVAEVVHADSPRLDAGRFRAKYGKDPNWGSAGKFGYDRKPSPLCFFFYGNLMPEDLKTRLKAFVPAPRRREIVALDQLPAAYDLPFQRWNEQTRTTEKGTEAVPLTVRETQAGGRAPRVSDGA